VSLVASTVERVSSARAIGCRWSASSTRW
jgi:hypothetical protein